MRALAASARCTYSLLRTVRSTYSIARGVLRTCAADTADTADSRTSGVDGALWASLLAARRRGEALARLAFSVCSLLVFMLLRSRIIRYALRGPGKEGGVFYLAHASFSLAHPSITKLE